MKQFFTRISRNDLAIFLCCCLMTAFIFSKYVLSMSMIGLIVICVFHLDFNKRFPLVLNPALKENVVRFWRDKALVSITLFFFIVFLSGFYSSDTDYLLERLRIKLPFLVLPFAFASLPAFSRRQYYGLFYFFITLLFITCIGVGVNYWQDFEVFNQKLAMGQAIPTPINHIRFSLALAFSIIAGIVLLEEHFFLKYRWERWILLSVVLFLAAFIHILTVRSGLAVFYLCLFYLSARYIYQTRRYALGILSLIVLFSLPLVAYMTIPSFQKRLEYARWDWHMHQEGKGDLYSDSDRLISVNAGMLIGNAHPVWGVGAGDLKKEVAQVYAEKFPNLTDVKMPHNQLVTVYAGSGLIGLALFLLAFFVPLFYRRHYRDPLFLSLHVIVFFSFMTESTIENAIGTAFYVFFLLLGINRLNAENL